MVWVGMSRCSGVRNEYSSVFEVEIVERMIVSRCEESATKDDS
jgi:hypothetical protein